MKPPWHIEAERWLGVVETPGPEATAAIVQFAHDVGLWDYVSDEDTWCSIFLAACLKRALPDEPLPKYPQWSRGYARWGVPLARPVTGAICVFWRGKRPEQDLGHTAFYVGETASTMQVLGGNQSDSVSITSQRKDKLVTIRWPSTFPLPEGQ